MCFVLDVVDLLLSVSLQLICIFGVTYDVSTRKLYSVSALCVSYLSAVVILCSNRTVNKRKFGVFTGICTTVFVSKIMGNSRGIHIILQKAYPYLFYKRKSSQPFTMSE